MIHSKKIEFKWALISIISFLIWMTIERFTGLHDEHIDKHQTYTLFYFFILITIYVFALIDKRKNFYGNRISYRQAFISGFFITILITLFSPLSQWIVSTFITPDYFNNVIKYSVETGYVTTLEEAKEQFNLQTYIIQSTIGSFLLGLIITTLVSFFVKKK